MFDDLFRYRANFNIDTKQLDKLLFPDDHNANGAKIKKILVSSGLDDELPKKKSPTNYATQTLFDYIDSIDKPYKKFFGQKLEGTYEAGKEAGKKEVIEIIEPQVNEMYENVMSTYHQGKSIITKQEYELSEREKDIRNLEQQIAQGEYTGEKLDKAEKRLEKRKAKVSELKQETKERRKEYEEIEKKVTSGKSNEEIVKEAYKEELNEYGKDLMEGALDAGIQRSKLEGQPNIAGVIDYAIDTNNRMLEIRQSQRVKDALLRQNRELAMLQRSDVYKNYKIRYSHLKKYEPEHMMKYKEPKTTPISQEPKGKEKLGTKEALEMEQRKFDEEISELSDIRTVNPSNMNDLLQREKAINAKIKRYRDTMNPDQLEQLQIAESNIRNAKYIFQKSLTDEQLDKYNKKVNEDISIMNKHDLDRFMNELKKLREQADVPPESKLSKDISEKIKEVTDKIQKKQEKHEIKKNIAAKIESLADIESIKKLSDSELSEHAKKLMQLDKEYGAAIKGKLHNQYREVASAVAVELENREFLRKLQEERLEEEAKKKEEEEAKKKEEFEANRKKERVVEAEIFKEAEAYRETLNKLRTIKFEQFANEPVKLMKEYVGLDFRKSPNQQLSMNMVETIEGHLDALLKDYVKEENVQKSYENQKILTTLSNIDEIPSHLSAKISKTLQTVSAKKLSSPRASPKKKTEPITKPTPKTKSKKKTGK